MKTIELKQTEKKLKHHPVFAKWCKRKRKRIERRYAKMGITTFLVPEFIEYEH